MSHTTSIDDDARRAPPAPASRFVRATGASAAAVATLVLTGWAAGIEILKTGLPGATTMQPSTALCFALLGMALWGLAREPVAEDLGTASLAPRVLGGVVAAIAAVTLLQYATGADAGIDRLLFGNALDDRNPHPGRMAPATAAAFLLLGLAVTWLDARTDTLRRLAQPLAVVSALIGYMGLLGYLYGVPALYRLAPFAAMAPHTSILIPVLALGLLWARHDRPLVAPVVSHRAGGRMARLLLPVAVVLPTMLGWLRLQGERLGFYGTPVGLGLFAATIVILFVVFGWVVARHLNRSEATRDELRRHELQLASALEHSSDAVVTLDLDGRVTSWSGGAARLFGHAAEEALGRELAELLIPEAMQDERARMREELRHGDQRHYEARRITRSGQWVDIDVSVTPMLDDAKRLAGHLKVMRDLTARRTAERSLHDEQERFRLAVESAPHGILVCDRSGAIVMVNRELERMLGYARDELLSMSVDALLPTALRDAHASLRDAFLADPRARVMGEGRDLHALRNDGTEVQVEIGIAPLRTGQGLLVLATVVDITRKKAMEEALREQASLLDLAPVIVRDIDSRIVYWSQGVETLYGYGREDAVGRVSHELLETEFPVALAEIDAALRRDGSWEGEIVHRRKDGRRIVVASRWVLHRDATGTPVRILEVNADVTLRRQMEDSQRRSQKLEALGTLAGGVAHDFNNLLLAIKGNVGLAREDLAADDPVQRNLAAIEQASRRAAELVQRILAFSRPQELERRSVSLAPVVDDAVKLLRATLPAAIELQQHCAAGVPDVAADPTQVHQVILNLATNAMHAIGDRAGVVEIKLEALDVDAELARRVPGLRSGRYARLSVSDDGCGMAPATLERIFDPFFTTKPVGQGTGLGLAVVHGIMKSHDGAISVYSEPGRGTVFRLYFPAATEASAPRAPSPTAPIPRGGHQRILYVDDEEALVVLATQVLKRLGYQVVGYTNPADALLAFRARPNDFDVVVTDLSMPVMSGFDLAREMLAQRPDLPVIMTSGYVRAEDHAAAKAAGIRDVITKPNTVEELGRVLDRLFNAE
jgi:PAS domain S-box-containing protein